MERALEIISVTLAGIYSAYTILLFASVYVGVHFAVAVVYTLLARRPAAPSRLSWLSTLDIIYGLLHPIIYLAVLQPAFLARGSSGGLNLTAAAVLACFWGLRFFGGAPRAGVQRRAARAAAYAGIVLVAAFFVKDLVCDKELQTIGGDGINTGLIGLAIPLYAIPAVMGMRLLHTTATDARWLANPNSFLLGGRLAHALLIPSVVLAASTFIAVEHQPSQAAVRAALLEHRSEIFAASERTGTDPRLIASIIGVTLGKYTNPFRRALERAAARAWLTDATSHDGLSRALNPSLGIAQVKPVTAMTAMVLTQRRNGSMMWSKQYRDLPVIDAGVWSLPLSSPELPVPVGADKSAIVTALEDPAKNVEFCAFILALYVAQWRGADPAWDIASRPEIAATLYQLGFNRSRPKPDPKPNEFGIEVRDFYRSEWTAVHFDHLGAAHAPAPR